MSDDRSQTGGRVLVAFEFGSINGGENSFLAVVDSLRKRNWNFTALVPGNSPLSKRLQTKQIPVVNFHRQDENGCPLSQQQQRDQIVAAIEQVRPTIVHCNSLSMSRLCGPVCRQLDVPSLGYLRDIIKISQQAMTDINQLDQIVAVSEATRTYHVERGLSDEKSITIHNGIDRQTFTSHAGAATSIRDELKLSRDSRLIICCGQIGMRKGIEILIEAFIQLLSIDSIAKSDVHLLLIGQRHSQKPEAIIYEKHLHERVRSAKIDAHVHFMGRRDDVAAIMQQSTLLAHAARQEPLGRVLLEAASIGLPIVATNVGGTSEILSLPEFRPCLVPSNDSTALSNAIQKILIDDAFRGRLCKQLQDHAESFFTVEACADKLHKQYIQSISLQRSDFERG